MIRENISPASPRDSSVPCRALAQHYKIAVYANVRVNNLAPSRFVSETFIGFGTCVWQLGDQRRF